MEVLIILVGLLFFYILVRDNNKNIRRIVEEDKNLNFVKELTDDQIVDIINASSSDIYSERNTKSLLDFLKDEKQSRGL